MPTRVPIDYRSFYKESPGALFECAYDDRWTILKASNSFYGMLGFEKDSLDLAHGDSFLALLSHSSREKFVADFNSYMIRHKKNPRTEPLFCKIYLHRHDRMFQPVQIFVRMVEDGHRHLSCVYMPCIDDPSPIELNNTPSSYDHIQEKLKQKSGTHEISAQSFSGKNVLLAEDHPLNVQMLTKMLSRYGINVMVAENGKKAVEMFDSEKAGFFAAILMDLQMPLLDGTGAAEEIRAIEKTRRSKKTVPIFAMFSKNDEGFNDGDCPKCFTDSLSKPITLSKLVEKMAANK